jgi:hypothetical protein
MRDTHARTINKWIAPSKCSTSYRHGLLLAALTMPIIDVPGYAQ